MKDTGSLKKSFASELLGMIIQDENKRISPDEKLIDELEFLALISIVYTYDEYEPRE